MSNRLLPAHRPTGGLTRLWTRTLFSRRAENNPLTGFLVSEYLHLTGQPHNPSNCPPCQTNRKPAE